MSLKQLLQWLSSSTASLLFKIWWHAIVLNLGETIKLTAFFSLPSTIYTFCFVAIWFHLAPPNIPSSSSLLLNSYVPSSTFLKMLLGACCCSSPVAGCKPEERQLHCTLGARGHWLAGVGSLHYLLDRQHHLRTPKQYIIRYWRRKTEGKKRTRYIMYRGTPSCSRFTPLPAIFDTKCCHEDNVLYLLHFGSITSEQLNTHNIKSWFNVLPDEVIMGCCFRLETLICQRKTHWCGT